MPVGERGEGLSGGQRQAIAIARAYLLQPPVLLLDEPSNAMDNRTEEHIQGAARGQLDGRTLLLITHRASLLSLVDRIIVLEAGASRRTGHATRCSRRWPEGRSVPDPAEHPQRCRARRATRRVRARDRGASSAAAIDDSEFMTRPSAAHAGAHVRAHWILWPSRSVVALVWAGLAHARRGHRRAGPGHPLGKVQIVQNLEGGIVAEILVEPGQSCRRASR